MKNLLIPKKITVYLKQKFQKYIFTYFEYSIFKFSSFKQNYTKECIVAENNIGAPKKRNNYCGIKIRFSILLLLFYLLPFWVSVLRFFLCALSLFIALLFIFCNSEKER